MPLFSPEQYSDLMSGYGDPDCIATLTEFQIGTNIRNLERAAGLITQELGGIPTVTLSTLIAINEMQQASVQYSDEMLRSPSLGISARLARKGDARQACGYIAQLSGGVAAAAFEVGYQTELSVLPNNGRVILDRLGSLAVTTPNIVHVTTGTDHLRIDDGIEVRYMDRESITQETPSWLPMRRLKAEAGGLAIAPFFDDLSPYGNHFTFPSGVRQTDEQYACWQTQFTDMWTELATYYPRHAEAIAVGLHAIIPSGDVPAGISTNSANDMAFGTLQMSTPQNTFNFSSNMLHTWLSCKIELLHNLYQLSDGDSHTSPLLYAPTHDNPETLNRLLLDTYVNMGLIDFFDTQMEKANSGTDRKAWSLRFARWYGMASKTIEMLREQPMLQEAGRRFVKEMDAQIASWQPKHKALPPAARRAGEITLTDHRLGWLLHNMHPDETAIGRLRTYWEAGDTCPGGDIPATIVPSTNKLVHVGRRSRYMLMGMHLSDPDMYDARVTDPQVHPEPHDLVPGNIAFAKGNFTEARRFYSNYIQHHPHSLEAWAGLAVTYFGSREVAAKTLLTRPHIAAHLYMALDSAQIDPIAVAEWLA